MEQLKAYKEECIARFSQRCRGYVALLSDLS